MANIQALRGPTTPEMQIAHVIGKFPVALLELSETDKHEDGCRFVVWPRAFYLHCTIHGNDCPLKMAAYAYCEQHPKLFTWQALTAL